MNYQRCHDEVEVLGHHSDFSGSFEQYGYERRGDVDDDAAVLQLEYAFKKCDRRVVLLNEMNVSHGRSFAQDISKSHER